MILDGCGRRGNGEKDAEGLAKARSRERSGKGKAGRLDRKEGVDRGRQQQARGRQGGGDWKGATGTGSNREGETGGGQRGGGDGEEQWGGGKEVRMGIGRLWEGAKRRGEEGARGGGISQMDMIACLGGHRL